MSVTNAVRIFLQNSSLVSVDNKRVHFTLPINNKQSNQRAFEFQQLLSSILQLGHAKLRTLYYYHPRSSDDRLCEGQFVRKFAHTETRTKERWNGL